MINLWQTLFAHAPHLFDTGVEHGPWLFGDTRKDHGPYPWMQNAVSYQMYRATHLMTRKLEESLIYGQAIVGPDEMKGLTEWLKSTPPALPS